MCCSLVKFWLGLGLEGHLVMPTQHARNPLFGCIRQPSVAEGKQGNGVTIVRKISYRHQTLLHCTAEGKINRFYATRMISRSEFQHQLENILENY